MVVAGETEMADWRSEGVEDRCCCGFGCHVCVISIR